MRIYNEERTQELNYEDIDLSLGYLVLDKLFIAHHSAVAGKNAEEMAKGLTEQGEICNLRKDGKWYRRTKLYGNGGSDEEEIKPVTAREAYDEYEDIQVYVLYTAEELKNRKVSAVRLKRENECFPIINRGQLWYDGLTEQQIAELTAWYKDWLNVTQTLAVPKKPEWLVDL